MNFPTFLIVNLQNKLNIEKFVNLVEKNYKNYKIIIASTKLHKKYKKSALQNKRTEAQSAASELM